MRRTEKGAALVLVLSLVALLSILLVDLNQTVRGTGNYLQSKLSSSQAEWYVYSGLEYALLKAKAFSVEGVISETKENMAYEIEDGVLQLSLGSLHGCFNVNSLDQQAKGSDSREVALKLLRGLLVAQDIDERTAKIFSSRLADWIDQDTVPVDTYGFERSGQNSPSPANQHIHNISELQSLSILDEEQFSKVRRFLCARPGDSTISINPNDLNEDNITLLEHLMNRDDHTEPVSQLIHGRPANGYKDLNDFLDNSFFATDAGKELAPIFSLKREYFSSQVRVTHKRSRLELNAILRINDKDGFVVSKYYGVVP